MAIVDMILKWSGDEAEAAQSGTAQLIWSITVSDPASDTAESVKSTATVPTEHPDDPLMFLTSFRVRRLSPIYFELEARYTKDVTGSAGLPPTERPVKVTMPPSVSFITTEEPVDVDADGNPLRNVNGEGYDPPCTQEFNDLILTFEKNVASVDYLAYRAVKGSVSSDEFFGFEAGVSRCLDISAMPAQEGDVIFFKQKTVIAFREPLADTPVEKTWWRRNISEGYYEKIDGRIVRALDEDGDEMTRPVLLDNTTGVRIADPTLSQWKYSKKFREVDFADYGII
jgi:hypothetical protein